MASQSSGSNRDMGMRYQAPRVSPSAQGDRRQRTRYDIPRVQPPRQAVERIKPLNPSVSRERISTASNSDARQKAKKSKSGFFCSSSFRDFLLGFVIGIAVFGIAAVIICTALINLIS